VRELIRRRALRPPPGSAARVRWPWPIEIDTLGGFRLRVANVGVPGGRLSGKPQALLRALVGLGGGARVEEGVLAALLWPRIDADYARRSLTTTLHRLRKLLGEDRAVLLRHGRLSLDPDVCRVDLQALDATLAAIEALDQAAPGHAEALTALADELLDCYRGPFMDGDDEAAFVPMRERVRNRVLAGLDSLARACEEAGAPQQALALYRRAIEQDPLAEVFHRRLMLSLRDTGRAAEAVEAYARCKSLLEAAGSAGPSAETQAIYEAVCKEI
jgi:DNA-binding SARP family transcriptional activator